MKVKILECENKYDLEEKINEKLKKYKNEDIIDIKYSGNGNISTYSINKYSAMIILK